MKINKTTITISAFSLLIVAGILFVNYQTIHPVYVNHDTNEVFKFEKGELSINGSTGSEYYRIYNTIFLDIKPDSSSKMGAYTLKGNIKKDEIKMAPFFKYEATLKRKE